MALSLNQKLSCLRKKQQLNTLLESYNKHAIDLGKIKPHSIIKLDFPEFWNWIKTIPTFCSFFIESPISYYDILKNIVFARGYFKFVKSVVNQISTEVHALKEIIVKIRTKPYKCENNCVSECTCNANSTETLEFIERLECICRAGRNAVYDSLAVFDRGNGEDATVLFKISILNSLGSYAKWTRPANIPYEILIGNSVDVSGAVLYSTDRPIRLSRLCELDAMDDRIRTALEANCILLSRVEAKMDEMEKIHKTVQLQITTTEELLAERKKLIYNHIDCLIKDATNEIEFLKVVIEFQK
tara:strand:+ start:4296 stop:5195 length:900 start_codon:yes stop_codon:yes gene_type:complete